MFRCRELILNIEVLFVMEREGKLVKLERVARVIPCLTPGSIEKKKRRESNIYRNLIREDVHRNNIKIS